MLAIIDQYPQPYWIFASKKSVDKRRGMSDQASGSRSLPDKLGDNAKKRRRNTISCFQVSRPLRRFRFLFMHLCFTPPDPQESHDRLTFTVPSPQKTLYSGLYRQMRELRQGRAGVSQA